MGPESLKESDRRVHRRLDTTELPTASVSIAHRPAISLVDLSSGGALIEMPFQLPSHAIVPLTLSMPDHNVIVPFKLLRCYVAKIENGVRYHAAGAFDQLLSLPGLTDSPTPSPLDRLITTLEALLRTTQSHQATATAVGFHELFAWVIAGLRKGHSARQIAIHIKAYLAQQFPSLSISAASDSFERDPRTSARFFGYDFTFNETLTRSDRRVLRAGAQMIALLDNYSQTELPAGKWHDPNSPPTMIVHSIGEWQHFRRSA